MEVPRGEEPKQASEIPRTSIEDHYVQHESLWHMKQFLRYSWWWPFSPKCLTQARQFLPKGSVAERDLGWRRKGRGDQCFYYRVAYKVREDNNGGEIVWGHEYKRARTMVWRLTDWATCELCGRGIRVYYTASTQRQSQIIVSILKRPRLRGTSSASAAFRR